MWNPQCSPILHQFIPRVNINLHNRYYEHVNRKVWIFIKTFLIWHIINFAKLTFSLCASKEHQNKHDPKHNGIEDGVFLVIMNGTWCLAHSQCHTSNLTICSVFYGFSYHEHNLLDFNDTRMVLSTYHKHMQLILYSKCNLTHSLHLNPPCHWRFSYLWHCREFTVQ
jgi:hypothetical protein